MRRLRVRVLTPVRSAAAAMDSYDLRGVLCMVMTSSVTHECPVAHVGGHPPVGELTGARSNQTLTVRVG